MDIFHFFRVLKYSAGTVSYREYTRIPIGCKNKKNNESSTFYYHDRNPELKLFVRAVQVPWYSEMSRNHMQEKKSKNKTPFFWSISILSKDQK